MSWRWSLQCALPRGAFKGFMAAQPLNPKLMCLPCSSSCFLAHNPRVSMVSCILSNAWSWIWTFSLSKAGRPGNCLELISFPWLVLECPLSFMATRLSRSAGSQQMFAEMDSRPCSCCHYSAFGSFHSLVLWTGHCKHSGGALTSHWIVSLSLLKKSLSDLYWVIILSSSVHAVSPGFFTCQFNKHLLQGNIQVTNEKLNYIRQRCSLEEPPSCLAFLTMSHLWLLCKPRFPASFVLVLC